jgi:hypothetical protein
MLPIVPEAKLSIMTTIIMTSTVVTIMMGGGNEKDVVRNGGLLRFGGNGLLHNLVPLLGPMTES